MSLKLSTGLRNHLAATGSLRAGLNGGFIKIYSGTAPLTADAALGSTGTNTLLVTISDDGGAGGLTFEATPADGVLSKTIGQTWSGTVESSGLASFFRWVMTGDAGTASTTAVRMQGDVSTLNAELNLANPNLADASDQPINHFFVAIPTP